MIPTTSCLHVCRLANGANGHYFERTMSPLGLSAPLLSLYKYEMRIVRVQTSAVSALSFVYDNLDSSRSQLHTMTSLRTAIQNPAAFKSVAVLQRNQMLVQIGVVQSQRLKEQPSWCNHTSQLDTQVAKASFIARPRSCPLPASTLNSTGPCSQPRPHQYRQIRLMSSRATHGPTRYLRARRNTEASPR